MLMMLMLTQDDNEQNSGVVIPRFKLGLLYQHQVMLFMGLSVQTLQLPLILLCESQCLAEEICLCPERMKSRLTPAGIALPGGDSGDASSKGADRACREDRLLLPPASPCFAPHRLLAISHPPCTGGLWGGGGVARQCHRRRRA